MNSLMIKKYTGKHKIVLAGPGAGKTHNMIKKVMEAMDNIESHRYIVVITYTNAATNEIKQRLSKLVSVPDNVYIGTIHSFMIRFIIEPYLKIVYEDMPNKKSYVEYNMEDINKIKDSKLRSIRRKILKDKLKQNGKISFDEIITLSDGILKKQEIREALSKRIKYLFVDEFQDANNKQAEVIESIRKGKHTKIECVGDPEQYIMSFSYKGTSLPTPKFIKIPFKKFEQKKMYEFEIIKENHRSSKNIVDFINNFNFNLQQKKVSDNAIRNINDIPVYFINNFDLNDVINNFKTLYDQNKSIIKDKSILYLSKANSNVSKISKILNLQNTTEISVSGAIRNTLKLLENISGETANEYMEEKNISLIQLRVKLSKLSNEIYVNNDIKLVENFIEDEFEINIDKNIKIEAMIKEYKNKFIVSNKTKNNIICMNIHNSKGLEAGSILVIAKDNNELSKWLERDYNIRCNDTEDTCRLGYVAFSRAKELLAIACLEEIDLNNMNILKELNVFII